MKKMLTLLLVISCMIISCSKSGVERKASSKEISGDWLRTSAYTNDYWGGPFYWQTIKANIQVRFSDGKYYRKNNDDNGYNFIGSYQILNDSTLQIQGTNPTDSSPITYAISYFFDADGSLNLNNGAFEGVVIEKFRKEEMNEGN
ncbi:hypothetical protein QTN47_22120 [Danxiaibacter flavus]|uniref:Lipocalin-like domain-containing protein n=1 Tax=Danxiaibacter flavus TaxID=3049108 RepID=A0ABV3ZK13_9BACT|nr:hypothetical protein QNM32_22125 [Chitinophagaceae bacterium DXS]